MRCGGAGAAGAGGESAVVFCVTFGFCSATGSGLDTLAVMAPGFLELERRQTTLEGQDTARVCHSLVITRHELARAREHS